MRSFIRQLRPSLIALVGFTLLLGVIYPLVTTAVAQVAFGDRADGSLVEIDGTIVGSELIGQPFVSSQYFHPRPSAAGAGYDGAASSGSNLGPLNPDLLDAAAQRVDDYRAVNGLDARMPVPVDAVTASGSGLDPHISVANARLQAPRVAAVRQVPITAVLDAVREATDQPALGVLGEPAVNVLVLNLALDRQFGDDQFEAAG
jgi:potassium-transporting ATPase KdpC subunit